MKQLLRGNLAQEISFMMLRIRIKVLQKYKKRLQQQLHKVQPSRRNKAEFERKRANRFLADLEKAKAENVRLLALLHQAQSKPHP
ncbi:hypothetical protein Dimus_030547 [Dionaea muscipula]